jgi:hypothetical protein
VENRAYRVAIVKWAESDGIAEAIGKALDCIGHSPVYFIFDSQIPDQVNVVLTFAPYGRFIQIARQIGGMPPEQRPFFVHWNMENPPDPRIPWPITRTIGAFRSWVDRLNDSRKPWTRSLTNIPPLSVVDRRMHKFRYVGEYYYAYRKGWLDLFVESSELYAGMHNRHGLPALCVPWGTARDWYADLHLERDIPVLWMGTRRTSRRSRLLDRVRSQLAAQGIDMYVADNEENPFIYDETRTRFLNRARITLNLLPTWYDHAFPYRFHVAAPNRSLVVSEPFLPHCSRYRAGENYVSAPPDKLAETIHFYLENESERMTIIDNAYRLTTTELTMESSLRSIMGAVDRINERLSGTPRSDSPNPQQEGEAGRHKHSSRDSP